MKPVHLLGLGFVIGMTALGVMVAAVSYRWAAVVYPENRVPGVAQQPAGQSGGPVSADVAEGKTIFAQKCSSCHAIGGGKLVGPDLKGVTSQRPHDSLVQFITAPDKVIASGDPTATQLVKDYGGVPMPNLGVTERQAEQLLAYIDFQTSGATPVSPSGPGGAPPSAPAPAAAASPAAGAPAAAPTAATAPTTQAAAPPAPAAGAPSSQAATQGKTIFDQKCASCHTIGGGKSVGPDLKGVTSQRPHDWLVQFITAPDKVIAGGDPVATQMVKDYGGMPMPNVGVTADQAEQILAYLQQQSGGGGAGAVAPPAATPLPPGSPSAGRALFVGGKPMANGGPACTACHNAAGIGALHGGTLGLDLTHSLTKSGEAGLVAIMKAPPFPTMKEAYDARPIADGEAADLVAFFAQVDIQQGGDALDYAFPLIALGLCGVLGVLARLAWRNQTPDVRKRLVRSH